MQQLIKQESSVLKAVAPAQTKSKVISKMDTCIEADIEDMLFGPDAMYDHPDFASDVSDDEILDGAEYDDEPNLWDLQNGPLLTPPLTDRDGKEHCGRTAQSLTSRDEQVLPGAMRLARDRWSNFTYHYSMC